MKYYFLSFLFSIISLPLFSQIDLRLGLKVGTNLVSIRNYPSFLVEERSETAWQIGNGIQNYINTYINADPYTFRSNWATTINAGGFVELAISKNPGIFIRSEFIYAQKGGRIRTNNEDRPWEVFKDVVRLHTFDIPLLIGIKTGHFPDGETEFRIFGGFVWSQVIEARRQFRKSNVEASLALAIPTLGTSLLFFPPRVEREAWRELPNSKSHLTAFQVGIGVIIPVGTQSGIEIDFRYERGIENLFTTQGNTSRTDMVQLNLGLDLSLFTKQINSDSKEYVAYKKKR